MPWRGRGRKDCNSIRRKKQGGMITHSPFSGPIYNFGPDQNQGPEFRTSSQGLRNCLGPIKKNQLIYSIQSEVKCNGMLCRKIY